MKKAIVLTPLFLTLSFAANAGDRVKANETKANETKAINAPTSSVMHSKSIEGTKKMSHKKQSRATIPKNESTSAQTTK